MSDILSNIFLIVLGGVLLVGMFYVFFKVLFSKNIYEKTSNTEQKPTKPTDRKLKPKFIGRT
jgi:flagellar basal body-associated protein FliL